MNENKFNEFFGRIINENNNVAIFHNTGERATRLDANVYPINSGISARYEHADGIILSLYDAKKLNISIE